MRIKTALLTVLTLAGLSLGQENYSNWSAFRLVTVNTSSGGAAVPVTQTNFPLLVRLTSSNFNFAQAAANGSDIRFTKGNGQTRLKHQIERWDTTAHVAEVWVLLDTVLGNNATQSIRLYYGRSGAADSSNGAGVFANGYQGAFHLGEASGDTARDATLNRLKGVPLNRGGVNPQDAPGVIGKGKNFLGTNATNNGGSYKLITAAGGNTRGTSPLNFQNDSSTVNGLAQYTVSAWVFVDSFPSGVGNRKCVLAKSKGVNGSQYHMRLLDPAVDQINHANDTNRVEFADGPSAAYKSGSNRITIGAWYYLTAVRSGAAGVPANLKLYVNAGAPAISTTSITPTTQSPYDVYIGSYANDSGYFNGKLDEVTFANVARDSNWVKLSYETQKPTAACVVVGGSQTPPPSGLSYTLNTAVYDVNAVITANTPTIGGAVTGYAVSPALPTGLSLNTSTGVITGTPTVVTAQGYYVVTATGPGGSTSATLNITVRTPVTGLKLARLANHFMLRLPGASQLLFALPPGGGVERIRFEMVSVKGVAVWDKSVEPGSGQREWSWDGKANDGHVVPAGVYAVRITLLDAERATLGSLERKIAYAP